MAPSDVRKPRPKEKGEMENSIIDLDKGMLAWIIDWVEFLAISATFPSYFPS